MSKIPLSPSMDSVLMDLRQKNKGHHITSLDLLQGILGPKSNNVLEGYKFTLEGKKNKNQLEMYSASEWYEIISGLFNKKKVTELNTDLILFGILLIDQNLGKKYFEDDDNNLNLLVSKDKFFGISNDLSEKGVRRWNMIRPQSTHSDSPAIVDKLDRAPFAEFLVDNIYQLQNEQLYQGGDSTLMLIDGRWGSGKTTLINLMKEKFQEKNWVVVDFNAWKNHTVDRPWWLLMDAVYKKCIPHLKKKKKNEISFLHFLYIFVREHIWRLSVNRRALYSLILAVVLLGIGGLFLYKTFSDGGNNISHIKANVSGISISNLTANIITYQTNVSNDIFSRIMSSLGGTGAGIITIIGGFLAIIGTVVNTVGSESTNKRFKESTSDPMNKISDHFISLARRIVRAKSDPKSAIVLIIDDLDRCTDNYVVSFLEDIKIVLTNPRVSCIVAADSRWIYNSYEQVYSNFVPSFSEPGYHFAKRFLDKIFQFFVSMPTISPNIEKRYWHYLLNQDDKVSEVSEADVDINKIKEIPEIIKEINEHKDNPSYRGAAIKRLSSEEIVIYTQNLLEPFYRLFEANPRSMKKFMIQYRIELAVNILSGCYMSPGRESQLKFALWVFVDHRWPKLTHYLRKYPEMVKHIGESEETLDTFKIPKDLHEIFHDQTLSKIIKGDALEGEKLSLDYNSIREILCLNKDQADRIMNMNNDK